MQPMCVGVYRNMKWVKQDELLIKFVSNDVTRTCHQFSHSATTSFISHLFTHCYRTALLITSLRVHSYPDRHWHLGCLRNKWIIRSQIRSAFGIPEHHTQKRGMPRTPHMLRQHTDSFADKVTWPDKSLRNLTEALELFNVSSCFFPQLLFSIQPD